MELRREPKNQFDEFAIAVFGHDVQLGYVSSERAALIAPMLDRGRDVAAIFQEETLHGCNARVAFDGEVPALPAVRERAANDPDAVVDDESGFWPDEVSDD